ncbi:Mth938-like domain-containing protein [Rhodoferax sp. PAMC 29310]|uniref:Mth938-like domain-containing protein n=1 Tax=Rhodoferax sp. PAMC 29310 TaxID=2822760 RepID=UPI001B31AC36|nr:Mth938-like domain-containing protein [Rhodoferax sp. PAMC 29310]
MKFQPDSIDVQSISGYGPGWISVGNEKISTSIVLGSRGERFEWNCDQFENLSEAHFAQLAALGTELIIFGSGDRIRFPNPAWIAPLVSRQIGIETMDVQAACRTYNILAGEGRHVAVALLMPSP